MADKNTNQVDKTIDKVIEYIDWFKAYDSALNDEDKKSLLIKYSNEVSSLLIETKTKVDTYFKEVVDQAVYKTNDYLKLRKFLIYWYSAFNVLGTQGKKVSDIEFIDKGLLLRSLGYDLYNEHNEVHQSTLCTEMSDIWAQKGTHLAMSKMISMLDINNFMLYEYWIDLDYSDNQLRFVPRAIENLYYNTGSLNLEPPAVKPFNTVVENDPHWYITEAEIREAQASDGLGLPSLSPYVGLITANHWLKNSKYINAYVNRVCNITYNDYITNPNFNINTYRKYYFYVTSQNISLLELYLCIGYVYNVHFQRTDDEPRDGTTQKVPHFNDTEEKLYDEIQYVTEFNKTYRRAYSRSEKDAILEEHKNKFETLNPIVCWTHDEAAEILSEISPDLYNLCNSMISGNQAIDFLTELLTMLDYYISHDTGLTAYTSLFMLFDPLKEYKDKIKKVFDFFKPIHTRLLDAMSYMIISDLPGDCFAVDEKLRLELRSKFTEMYNDLKERIRIKITAKYHDIIGRADCEDMFYDFVDVILQLKIIEPRLIIEDKIIKFNMKQLFVEYYTLCDDMMKLKINVRNTSDRFHFRDSFRLVDMKEIIRDRYEIVDVTRKPLYKLNVEHYVLCNDKVDVVINDSNIVFDTITWDTDILKEHTVDYSDDTHPAYSIALNHVINLKNTYAKSVSLNRYSDNVKMSASEPFSGTLRLNRIEYSENVVLNNWTGPVNNEYTYNVNLSGAGVTTGDYMLLVSSNVALSTTVRATLSNNIISIKSDTTFNGRIMLLRNETSKTFDKNNDWSYDGQVYKSTLNPVIREGTFASKEYIINVFDNSDNEAQADYNYAYTNYIVYTNIISVL